MGYMLVAVCLLDEAGCLPEEHFLSLFQAVLGFLCAANESLNVGEGTCQGVDAVVVVVQSVCVTYTVTAAVLEDTLYVAAVFGHDVVYCLGCLRQLLDAFDSGGGHRV